MPPSVRIFGKDSWPYTTAAREAFADRQYDVQYHDVQKDRALLEEMLALTKGRRSVPVILEAGKVTIGYGGTW